MTWTRIGDDFTDKPEILGLDGDTFRLHIEGLVWCNKHLTDGRLPTVALARITAHPDAVAGVAALVSAGLWAETENGWQLDWSEQEAAERVEGRREDARTRKARERAHAKGDHSLCDRCAVLGRHGRGDHSECAKPWCPDGVREASRGMSRVTSPATSAVSHAAPDPTRPDPKGREGEGEGAAPPASADAAAGASPPKVNPSPDKGGSDYDVWSDPNATEGDRMAAVLAATIANFDEESDLDDEAGSDE